MTEEIKYWLSSIATVGGTKVRKILAVAGSPQAAFSMSQQQFEQIPGIGAKTSEYIIYSRNTDRIKEGLHKIEACGMRLVCEEEKEFPENLRKYSDSPFALYVIGKMPESARTVAIVGARNCTAYGKYMAETAGRLLSQNGIQVISGMAMGIDACGHWGAVLEGGMTFAVLGSGADVCYPKCNLELYHRIKETGGILSEYPPGTPGLPQYFPARNRIISQLADIVLVVEAKERSGSLITADMALEYGKDVYAVPGRGTDTVSIGCNRLIQQGAGIVVSPETLLEDLHLVIPQIKKNNKKNKMGLENKNDMLYSCLDFSPKTIEEVERLFSGNKEELLEGLLELELSGVIRQTIPGTYIRVK